jgi:hypothetical protein
VRRLGGPAPQPAPTGLQGGAGKGGSEGPGGAAGERGAEGDGAGAEPGGGGGARSAAPLGQDQGSGLLLRLSPLADALYALLTGHV